jgi:DUF4097 and DUF4098 domain-containing protein YvlB
MAVQDPPATREDRPQVRGRSAPFDQTINVPKGTRIDLRDCVGEAVVKTWNRDAVQVRASGARRSNNNVKATLTDKVLTITGDAGDELIDFELLVPAWIDVQIEGRECGIEIDGITGNVTARNTDGDIVLRGLGGTVDAESLDGDIVIDGGHGRIKATSSDGDITITNASGDLQVASTDGDVRLTDVQATSADVSNVDGEIVFSGPLPASGKYRFTSHDGDVTMTIPENSSATFTIRRYQGELYIEGLTIKAVGEVRRGRRATYTLGGGAAQVEIETFDGNVHLLKPGIKKKIE